MPMELVRQLPYTHPYRWDGTLFGGPKLWRPDSLGSNLALWLDAEDASTITLNGSTVSQWNDKSGNGRNVSQATATNQPTYQATGLNAKPTLSSDGNDVLRGTVTINELADAVSVFCVSTLETTSASYARLVSYQASGNPNDFGNSASFSLSRNIALQEYFLYRNNASVATIATTYSQASIIGAIYNGTNGTLYEDGTASTSGASVGAFGKTATLSIFNTVAGTETWVGKVSEIVMASSALSTINRQRLEGYLAWKWGLESSLPSTHPYKLLPPTV